MKEVASVRVFDGARLAATLVINWLTPLVGLGNLIFLWRDKGHRRRASVALGLTLGMFFLVIPTTFILLATSVPQGHSSSGTTSLVMPQEFEYTEMPLTPGELEPPEIQEPGELPPFEYKAEVPPSAVIGFMGSLYFGIFFALWMNIWMTVDALIGYSKYKLKNV